MPRVTAWPQATLTLDTNWQLMTTGTISVGNREAIFLQAQVDGEFLVANTNQGSPFGYRVRSGSDFYLEGNAPVWAKVTAGTLDVTVMELE